MFLVNSRYPYSSATPLSSPLTDHHGGHTFSRSYGIILPSSLTWSYPKRLSILYLTTCVGLRYGRYMLHRLMGFFSEMHPITEGDRSPTPSRPALPAVDFPAAQAKRLHRYNQNRLTFLISSPPGSTPAVQEC